MAIEPTLDIRLRVHEKADRMELVKVNGLHTTPLRDRLGCYRHRSESSSTNQINWRGSVNSPHQTRNIGDMTMTSRIKNKKSASGCHLETLMAEMDTRQMIRIHYTSFPGGMNHG